MLEGYEFIVQPYRCKYVTYSESKRWNLSSLYQIEVVGFPFSEECIKSTFYVFCILKQSDKNCSQLIVTEFAIQNLQCLEVVDIL